ncbi:MAG: ATP-binding protein [Gammaproteobacteria bacterium]
MLCCGLVSILEKNQFIESILNFTPDLLYLYDIIEQKNVYSNKGIQVVLGYSVDEIQAMGSDLMPCLMHPGDFQDYCEKTYPIYSTTPDNTEITHQYRFKHKDGEWRWLDFCEFIYSREPDGSPRQIFGVAQDVTEKLSLEEQLRHIQKMEAVGRLAGGVAHDFNNQLGVILGYGENLIGKLHDSDPLQKDAKEIVAAGKRSAALTRQLLTFSRKQTLQFKLIDLNDLIRNLDKMLRRLIGEDIQLELKLSHNPVIINVDLVQIEQVILNLAINSRDAMPQGGELIIETSCTDLDESYATKHDGVVPGHYVLLTVSDTGCGMDEETLCRIFEPFFTTKGLGRGTGLGLATVYGIVKQSGGSLRAYSEPGKGTTFKIYLPLIEGVVETEKVKLTEKIYNGQVEHILLVEDDDSLRTLFTIMLSEIGYQITTAANGDEALLLVEEKGLRPDLMITDVIMPGMSGSVLIDRLSKTMPNLKFIYMSGYTDDSISHHGVLDSDTPFIQKPFNTEDIIAKINEVMAAGDK